MKKSALLGLGLLSLSTILIFQNCANPHFEESEFSSASSTRGLSGDSYDSYSADDGKGPGNSSSQGNSYSGGSSVTKPPVSIPSVSGGAGTAPTSGGGSAASGVQPPGSSGASVVGCSESLRHMGWQGDLNQVVNVELSGFDNMDKSGAQEIYSYGGFQIQFDSKPRAGVSKDERYTVYVPSANSGLKFRFVDINTKKTVEVLSSDYGTSNLQSANRHLDTVFNSYSVGTSVGVSLKRDFYERNKSVLGYVQVEMYCNNKLIARGIQDFKALDVQMSKKLVKTSYGTYTSAVQGTGFVSLSCPKEVAAGSKVSCSSSGAFISSRSYEVNYIRESKFDNLAEISYANVPAGVHYVQTKVKYSSGIEDRSQLRTIRVK